MIVYNAVVSPSPDGVQTVFACPNSYIENTLQVYLNGQLQTKENDYTETAPGLGTFTYLFAPQIGDIIRTTYWTTAPDYTVDRVATLITNVKLILPARYKTNITDDSIYLWLYITLQDINQIPMKTGYTMENVPTTWDAALLIGTELYVALFVMGARAMQEFAYSNAGRSLTIDHFSKVGQWADKLEKQYSGLALNVKKALFPRPVSLGTPKYNQLLLRPFSCLYPSKFSTS